MKKKIIQVDEETFLKMVQQIKELTAANKFLNEQNKQSNNRDK